MSEVLEPPVTGSVTAALQVLRAAVDDVVRLAVPGPGGGLWMLSGPELLEAAEVVHRASCRADAVLHGLVREIDARGAATETGLIPRPAGCGPGCTCTRGRPGGW